MNAILTRKLVTAGLLSLCVVGLSIQAQTASPGPPSRNANVDREDPNKPDTPEHEIPNQEAPGSGTNNDTGAAGQSTPTGGDGSAMKTNRDPTQQIPRNSAEQNAASSAEGQGNTPSDQGDTDQTQSNANQGDRNDKQGQDADTGDEPSTSASGKQAESGQEQHKK